MRVLCLAAHPDDEVLGAGGTLLKHRAAGDETFLAVATVAYEPVWSAETIRRKRDECLAAAALLKFTDVRILDYRTMHLNTVPAIDLARSLSQIITDWRADVVYAPPCDDVNQDHAALFSAAQVACRHIGAGAPRALYSYEIPTTSRFNLSTRWAANTYVDIAEFVGRKLEAMAVYETELRQPPHPRSLEGIRTFARERGLSVGLEYAETHMLVRALR
jgi:LmbE family N-acetylglucosaminyl deacetylase